MAASSQHMADIHETLPCMCNGSYKKIAGCMQQCINCRREVEESLTRLAGRRLRQLRNMPACSVDKCVEFLRSIKDEPTRLHLASMAWWRFSSDTVTEGLGKIRAVMSSCRPSVAEFSVDYMHAVMRLLSPLTQEQITAWFGLENVYQIADLFIGGHDEAIGDNCSKCKLYKRGCNIYSTLSANTCTLWKDEFVQKVASIVAKHGKWDNPCASARTNKKK